MTATPITIEITQADLDEYARRRRQQEYGYAKPLLDEEKYPRIWDINDLANRPPAQWLIENVVEEEGLCIFFGPDKAGKTAMLSSFLWAWCAGRKYFLDQDFWMNAPDREETRPDAPPRRVLYVLLEGQASFYSRYDAWMDTYNDGKSIEGFYVMDDGLSLFDQRMKWDNVETWTNSAKRLRAAIEELQPHVLVIDTLSRATAGMDENSPQMAQVVGVIDSLRDTYGLTTVVVHHTSLAEQTRPRGHSSLKGAASSYVSIMGEPESPIMQLKTGPHRNSDQSRRVNFMKRSHRDAFIVTTDYGHDPMEALKQMVAREGKVHLSKAAHRIYGEVNKENFQLVRGMVASLDTLMLTGQKGNEHIVAAGEVVDL